MQQLEELFTNPLVKFLIVLLSVKNFINNNILVKFRSLLYKLNGHEAWMPWLYHHTNLMDVSVQVISFTLICSMFMCVYKYVAMWVRCHGTAVWQLALNVCVCVCVCGRWTGQTGTSEDIWYEHCGKHLLLWALWRPKCYCGSPWCLKVHLSLMMVYHFHCKSNGD